MDIKHTKAVETWSSVAYGAFMNAWRREMRALGWEAELRHHLAEAEYRNAKTRGQRFKMRWRSYAGYPLRLLRDCRRGPERISIVCSNTFYAPGIVARWCARQVTPVHLMYDLFPDVLVHAGKIRAGGLADRLMIAWQRKTFRLSAANVFLGEHLLSYAEERHGKIPRAVIIPVGAEGAFFKDKPPVARAPGAVPVVYYGGNFGRMHDVDTVAAAISGESAAPGFAWRFQGNGPGFSRLEKLRDSGALLPGVSLGGNLPDAAWTDAMLAADIALVTMLPGAERVVMPSKTYSALVAGQAILAIAPLASDLADLVLKHDCGWVIEPESLAAGRPDHGVAGLKVLLARLATNPAEILRKRENAYRAGHDHYAMDVVAKQWDALLKNLETSDRR